MKDLHDNEDNPTRLWAEIHNLRSELKGPGEFTTWRDAAIDEKLKRIELEKQLAFYEEAEREKNVVILDMQERDKALKIATHLHYKGGLYRVLYMGIHSETQEKMVIYEHLWPHERQVWVRPLSIWCEPVYKEDGTMIDRFAAINNHRRTWGRRLMDRIRLWVFP